MRMSSVKRNKNQPSRARVVRRYRSEFPDPLFLNKREKVSVEKKKTDWEGWLWCTTETGRKGWVPETYLEVHGAEGEALRDYDGTELSVIEGDRLTVLERESGWLWCLAEKGGLGWVPEENVECVSPQGGSGEDTEPF